MLFRSPDAAASDGRRADALALVPPLRRRSSQRASGDGDRSALERASGRTAAAVGAGGAAGARIAPAPILAKVVICLAVII